MNRFNIPNLNDADTFSELDLNKAFHQIELEDEDSKNITAFETSKGIFRYKKLNMGIHNASEYLQKAMKQKVIKGLKRTRSIADNVIVAGKGRAQHDEHLLQLCERLRSLGLTVGRDNCKLGVSELEFFGLKISAKGVALGNDKVEALKSASQPATPSELRSFLGLAVYGGNFIPNLATISDPLWDLLKQKDYEWKEEHEKAFLKVKEAVLQHALSFFNPLWDTEVTVDASPCGLGAVLGQVNPTGQKNDRKIVNFASKRLSMVEKRYSQVEKEALAVVWACKKLHLYLFGREFNHRQQGGPTNFRKFQIQNPPSG